MILLVFAFVLFVVETVWHKSLTAAGLGCWVAASIFHF